MNDTPVLVAQLLAQAREAYRAGRLAEAEQHYRRIIAIDPRHADSVHALGVIASDCGRFDAAAELFSRAITIKNDVAAYHVALALALDRMGRLPEAVARYRAALALEPQSPAVLGNLGVAYGRMGDLNAAASCFDRALVLNPEDFGAQYNLALTFERQGKLDQALAAYERALVLKPDAPETLNSLGTVLFAMQRLDEALARIDQALALRPDYVDALNNRGTVLLQVHRPAEALACYDRVLALAPNHVIALGNRGTALVRLKRLDEALVCFERAQKLSPDFAEPHWSESLCRLLVGDFERGWQKYEWRWRVKPQYARHFRQPQWSGAQDLSGKSILLHAEQGFGDTLQFCRYVPLVAARGARVVLAVSPELGRLFASLAGVSELHLRSETLPETDYHCALLSLPLAFKTVAPTIPDKVPYLTVPSDALAKWRERLADVPHPRIGLAWSGRLEQVGERHRAISPAQLTPLLSLGATVVSLQKDYRPEDREWLAAHPEVLDFAADIADFADTAALASLVDIVVSIDTAAAHLAGALGSRLAIMLSYIGDWRWMVDRADSPWYPTARLYRQSVINDWTDVIARVALELRESFSPPA